jgi:NAD(P)H dehydrogenase (quinone)
MIQNHGATLLVTGASGHLGRRVVEFLLEADTGPIIAVTRHPEKLNDLIAGGVTVRRGDFDDPASLDGAFAGAERLLLISTDDADPSGRRLEQHRAAIAAAVRAGATNVIYTSLSYPDPGNPITFAYQHFGTEQALANTTLEFTILRNNFYAEVVLWMLPRAVATGQLVSAGGDGGVGFVTREDCARVAAAVLASSASGRRYRDITGPEIITGTGLAKIASDVVGRPIRYVRISPEEIRKALIENGVPPGAADTAASFDVAIAQGRMAFTTNGVTELAGGKPKSLRAFLHERKAEFLASSAAEG